MGRRRPYKGRDRFGKKAKAEGYEARSVYKLEEIQRRTRILQRGQRVVDLGCYPGSWSQYVLEQIGGQGTLVGVDLKAPELSGGTWIDRSVYDVEPDEILEALGGEADVVLSDMAPNTTGHKFHDHVKQIELATRALAIADEVLAHDGAFVAKIFDGSEAEGFVAKVKERFGKLKRVKPEATRQRSREYYVVGRKFQG